MALDRIKFLQLGGFDSLYYPAYVEDVDLCFRAWRNGWRCIFEPASQVLHREGGSWKATKDPTINSKILRNSLLFQWLNFPASAHRIRRWWSAFKISIGEILRLRLNWPCTYFHAQRECLRLKFKYPPTLDKFQLQELLRRCRGPVSKQKL